MTQDSTIIEDSENNTLNIVFSNNIVEPGGAKPGITDEIFDFKLPGSKLPDLIDQDFPDIGNLPPTGIPGTPIIFDIPMVSFTSDPAAVALTGCIATSDLDQPIFSEFPAGITNTYEIISLFSAELSTFQINGMPVIDSLKYINYAYGGEPEILRNIVLPDIASGATSEFQGNIGVGIDAVQFGDSLKN